jgi:hypothetical protein
MEQEQTTVQSSTTEQAPTPPPIKATPTKLTPIIIAIVGLIILTAGGIFLSNYAKSLTPASFSVSATGACVPSLSWTCQNATISSKSILFTTVLSSNSADYLTFNGILYNVQLACLSSSAMDNGPESENMSIVYTPLSLISTAESNIISPGDRLRINLTCYGGPAIQGEGNPYFILIGYTWNPGPINYTTNRWNSGEEVAVAEER